MAAKLTAEAKGVYAIGYHSDMSKFGPKAHLTASIHDWRSYYEKTVRDVMAGKWKSTGIWTSTTICSLI